MAKKDQIYLFLFIFCTLGVVSGLSIVLANTFSLLVQVLLIVFITVCLHYLFNLVHLASHYQTSKNKVVNYLIGSISAVITGISFADFSTTHSLHHRNPGDENKDPDYAITHGSLVLFLPFKIFWHDIYFWRNNLFKKNYAWLNYLLTRLLQLTIVTMICLSGNGAAFVVFWLLPMYFLGFANGLFLFYLPHNHSRFEKILPELKNSKNWLNQNLAKFIETPIEISRIYHEHHHDNVADIQAYFPFWSFVNEIIKSRWNETKLNFRSAYISGDNKLRSN